MTGQLKKLFLKLIAFLFPSVKDLSENKEIKLFRINTKVFLANYFYIILGILAASFGLKSFLLPNSFIDGGVTGISLITRELTGISLSILIVAINLPFIILAFSQIGKQFAIKSIIAILGLALALQFLVFPIITTDKLLIAVFGGFFLGMGIGLAIRGGAVLDGTEVLAIFISKKTGLTIGDIIFLFNVIIFLFGAYVLSIEIALYAVLTYLSASKTVDFVIEGVEEYIGITIISNYSEEIRLMIIDNLGRGVTLYAGKRGYGKNGNQLNAVDIVYTVISRLEIARLKSEISKIDSDAFIVMSSVKDIMGGMIKKRPHIN